MPKVYRGMLPDNGKPMIGSTAKTLGVRVGIDITPDKAGNVHPGTGGMSVVPRLLDLRDYRIPERLRTSGAPNATGDDKLRVWTMGDGPFVDGPFAPGLCLRVDTSKPHGQLEPDRIMTLDEYLGAIRATQDQWLVDEFIP